MSEERLTVQELIDLLQRTLKEQPDVKYIAFMCDGCGMELRLHQYKHVHTLDELIEQDIQ